MLRRMSARRPSPRRSPVSAAQAHAFADELFGDDFHAKRVRSLADSTLGVLHAGELGIHAIGRGIAAAKGLVDKHAIKQVDRCIGNEGIDVEGRGAERALVRAIHRAWDSGVACRWGFARSASPLSAGRLDIRSVSPLSCSG